MATVTVSFGSCSRLNDEITARWIGDQVRSRRADGVRVCASVRVEGQGIDLKFAAGECGQGAGGVRRLSDLVIHMDVVRADGKPPEVRLTLVRKQPANGELAS